MKRLPMGICIGAAAFMAVAATINNYYGNISGQSALFGSETVSNALYVGLSLNMGNNQIFYNGSAALGNGADNFNADGTFSFSPLGVGTNTMSMGGSGLVTMAAWTLQSGLAGIAGNGVITGIGSGITGISSGAVSTNWSSLNVSNQVNANNFRASGGAATMASDGTVTGSLLSVKPTSFPSPYSSALALYIQSPVPWTLAYNANEVVWFSLSAFDYVSHLYSNGDATISGVMTGTRGLSSLASNGMPGIILTNTSLVVVFTNTNSFNVEVTYSEAFGSGNWTTSIAKNGGNIFINNMGSNALNATFHLQPNEYFQANLHASSPPPLVRYSPL